MTFAIETDRLTKRFRSPRSLRAIATGRAPDPERTAVDEVSLAIGRGEVFGLLGQNGAGKTTLVRMLTTLLLPTSGEGRIDGLDLRREPRAIRARVGLVNGDERSFYWRLTGRQNLEFFGALRQLDRATTRAAVDRMAERLGLTSQLDRRFGTLSSGQRQGLAIIRGLLGDPDILFMDEPTRSLDPISADRLRRFVADVILGELGRTVVLATHSMPEAEALCDRVAFIQDGRIVAAGTVPELRRAIGYGVRCELRVRDLPDGSLGRLARLPGTSGVAAERIAAAALDGATTVVRLTLRDPDALPAVLQALLAEDVAIIGCQTAEPSLEEVYIRTLGRPTAEATATVAVSAR